MDRDDYVIEIYLDSFHIDYCYPLGLRKIRKYFISANDYFYFVVGREATHLPTIQEFINSLS